MRFDDIAGHQNELIALRMRLSRKGLGLTQVEFAERAGLRGNAVANYETGTNRPSLEAVAALRDTYGMTSDWIYFGDPSSLPYDLAVKILREMVTGTHDVRSR